MDAPLKVLIADDHPLMLQGIRRALESADDMEVAGEARCGEELLALVDRREPDIVLLDLNMPAPGGIECVARIRETHPEIKAVVISAYDDRSTIDAALEAGASAYMMKSVSSVDVASALRQVASGAVFHAPSAPQQRPSEQGTRTAGDSLTARERTILEAVANGLTTRAISGQLWLSEHTVKFHLTNIYRKLGVANRSAAVRYAFEEGLVGGVAACDP
jgi:two-component system NarL family response regulator